MTKQRNGSVEKQVVYIVDDEEVIRELCVDVLEDYYEVVPFSGPLEALEQLEGDSKPDVIISDITMPKMSGIEFARRLQAMEYPGNVIIISGNANKSDAIEALGYGVYAVMEKPFSIKQFCFLVHRAATATMLSQMNADIVKTFKSYGNKLQLVVDDMKAAGEEPSDVLLGLAEDTQKMLTDIDSKEKKLKQLLKVLSKGM